jgi:pyruvate-formate lyase-activating enzyme
VEYRLGCDNLGKQYAEWRDNVRCCVVPGYFHVSVPAGDTIEENHQLYKEYVGTLIDSMRNGEPGACKGCRNLKFDIFDREQNIVKIAIGSQRGKDFCNAKCFYCEQYPMPSETARTHRKEEIMKEVHYFKTCYPDTDFFFDIEAGDISVASFRSELLNFLIDNNYGACIRTNAFVYCAEVATLLELGKSYLWVTLDSTKPEIYKKCKGLPSVDVVKDNLREYAKHGPVCLKWIALENIYVSFDDVKGIIDFASEIDSPYVIVSADTNNIMKPSSEELLELVKEFVVYAKKKSVPTYILYNQFHEQTATEIQKMRLETI